ncbi:MSMEG_0570 family nitrogen starvation response protein [Nocardia nova]|uniref:MSMEG_0570 family nitrogen starvation response protein n=1 Tax=Nocardia nova TaxID=37330 RepID=A0A2S6AL37_9NOCA|nr:MSMEG_0570 family nitrogen starvation response protein [Nocardia nova]PPJ31694.1 MSMEG_0570 family nitrogen starvation response protein [Nocardia nova]PPJ35934.1 MSMEG_0570 family nitrogen starvation response protein [Nocardia nova]
MPEMTFDIRWPDGSVQSCYSPSLVIHDHLSAGTEYPVGEFVRRAATALNLAAERVRERFGLSCTSAMQTLADIESAAATSPRGTVRVLTMTPPSVPAATPGGKP